MTSVVLGAPALEERLEQGLKELGIDAEPAAIAQLLAYLSLLEKWNRVYNLTSIRDQAKMVSVHILDSLAVLPYLAGDRVLDVGSGAGLPGIPIAIVRPETRVCLLDSSHKKTAFLRQATTELKLRNTEVACERVESWRPREKFACIVSRALADLAEFVALTEHLLAPDGVLVAMKGVYPYEELERLPPGFRPRVQELRVPGLGSERHLVLVERA